MSKKTNFKNDEPIPWNIVIKNNQSKFLQKLNTLRRMVKIWHDDQDEKYQQGFDFKAILIQYAKNINEIEDQCDQKLISHYRSICYDQQLKFVQKEKQIYLGFELIDQKIWKINFSKRFIKQLSMLSQVEVKHIFMLIFIYTQGFLPLNGTNQFGFRPAGKSSNFHQLFFHVPINIQNKTFSILINICIQKKRFCDFKNNQISGFEFHYFLQFQRIQSDKTVSDERKLQRIIRDVEFINQNNPKLNYKQEELTIIQKNINPKLNYIGSKRYHELSQKVGLTFPFTYKVIAADQIQLQNYYFLLKKFKFYQNQLQYLEVNSIKGESQMKTDQQENSQYLRIQEQISQYRRLQFKETVEVVKILRKIPNFKYRLTNQQRQTLSQDGNLIVVGRSGTGKTTCAMLRLFGIQHITKMKQINIIMADQNRKDKKCKLVIFEELQLNKNMLLTFSPILIQQIKKQYNDMLYQIKQNHATKCQSCKTTFQKKKTFNNQQDPIDKLNRLLREQEKQVTSLQKVSNKRFPAFYTIQNFLKMIDKTIDRPFFDHELQADRQNNLVGIKQAFINRYNYFDQNIELIETIQAVYVDYDFFEEHIWRYMPKQFNKASNQFNLLTPSIVWSEILSIIKGSVHSYTCPQGFISLKMYLNQKRNIFQNYQEQQIAKIKIKVYSIFKIYHNWCKTENGYDLMDVVNHLLQQTQFFGYKGPKINYMFIDEVQDLTSATIFLLSKMVLNNVFYCGDTAQAITKGIDFRFQDIKYIFNKDYCKNAIELDPPSEPINLSVNFRSHNCILQLANSVISSIEEIFPKSISKLKNRKEQSDLVGPKPNIIFNRIDLLLELICGQNNSSKQVTSDSKSDTRKFNCQQVIIVRNQQQKLKLPPNLQQGLILTPQTAKGLQYDEIILYNFFSSCTCYQKWKVLDYLDVQIQYKSASQFENQLNKRKQEENQNEEQRISILSINQKKLLGYSQEDRMYIVKTLIQKPSLKEININAFFEIATQLKLLYTIITRSRNVFVIYDQKIPNSLLKIWQKMDLVTIIEDQNINEHRKYIEEYSSRQIHVKYINENQQWIAQGEKMLFRRQYEEAKKCYKRANKQDIVQRIQAMEFEIKADNELYRINNQFKKLNQCERILRKINKIKLQKQKNDIILLYIKAGDILFKYNRFSQAAKLFYKGQDFRQALYCFRAIDDKINIAECYMKLEQYQQAAQEYEKLGDIKQLVKCYTLAKNWKKLYKIFRSHEEVIRKNIQKKYIRESIHNLLNHCIQNQEIQQQMQSYSPFNTKKLQQTKNQYFKQSIKEVNEEIRNIINQNNYWRTKKIFNQLLQKKQKYLLIVSEIKKVQKENKQSLTQKEIDLQQISQISNEIKQIQKQLQQIQLMKQNYKTKSNDGEVLQIFARRSQKLTLKKSNYLQILRIYKNNMEQTIKQIKMSSLKLEQLQNKQSQQIKFIDIQKALKEIKDQLKQAILDKFKKQNKIKEIKQKISKFNNSIQNFIYDDSVDDDIMSVSDISQMGSFWEEQESNIIGINITSFAKKQIMKQIQQILALFYPNMMTDQVQNYQNKENIFHYRYIQNKIKNILKDSGFKHLIQLLERCEAAQQINCCLLIIDTNPQLVTLALKYITMFILQLSDNYKSSRQIAEEQITQKQQIKAAIYKVNKLMCGLSEEAFQHKIPKQSLLDKFYNESILCELVPGLVLQGFYKQAFLFCDSSSIFKLAYLFSDYESMVNEIKKIAKKNHNLKISNKKYLFLTDNLIFNLIPESKALNVFSTQNIFYAYDQYQNEPFLNKKIKMEQIDIQEDVVNQIINERVSQRWQELKYKKSQLKQQNKQLQTYIQTYRNHLNQNYQYSSFFKEINYDIIQQLKAKLNQKLEELNKLGEQLSQIGNKVSKSLYLSNKHKINKENIKEKEKEIQNFRQKIQTYKSKHQIDQVQKCQQQRQKAVKKYAQQRQLQKKSQQEYCNNKEDQKHLQFNIKNKQNQIQRIHQQIYDKEMEFCSSSNVSQFIQSHIYVWKIQIQHNKNSYPKQLNFKDQSQIKKSIENSLISEQKQRIYIQKKQNTKERNKQQIKQSSNIPSNYKFLRYYLDDQLSFKNKSKDIDQQKIAKEYQNILKEGIDLEKYQADQNGNEAICRIVIFYLSIMFNRSFQEDVMNYKTIIQEKNSYNYGKIFQLNNQLQQYKKKLNQIQWKIYNYQQHQIIYKKEGQSFNIKEAKRQRYEFEEKINATKDQLIKYPYSKQSPGQLIHCFLQTMFKRIKNLNSKNIRFMQILFGFFQCRIIRDCPILDFLAHQYVLVRSNSIVIDKMKNKNNFKFCYYFDQQRTTVLCLFEDVQNVILNLLEKQHLKLYDKDQQQKMNNFKNYKVKNVDKKKYMDAQMIGFIKKKPDENSLKNNLLICNQKYEKDRIRILYYDYYLQNILQKQIKPLKRELLTVFFQTKFNQKNSYFFIIHQLKELNFIEQLYALTNSFNPDVIQQMITKLKGLQREFERWKRGN